MTRLVTAEDIQKYPALQSQGVSINMNWDFPDEPTEVDPIPPIADVVEPPKKQTPKKAAPKKTGKKK